MSLRRPKTWWRGKRQYEKSALKFTGQWGNRAYPVAELFNADVEGSNMGPSVLAERAPTFSFLSLPSEAKSSSCCLKAELAFLTYTAILNVCTVSDCLLGLLCFCKYRVDSDYIQNQTCPLFTLSCYPTCNFCLSSLRGSTVPARRSV